MPKAEDTNIQPFTLKDLGGGLNAGTDSPVDIGDNQHSVLTNFYPYGPNIIRRPGLTKLVAGAYTEALTSLFAYHDDAGNWVLMAGALTGVARQESGSYVTVSIADGVTYASNTIPWQTRQYKNVMLWARRGTGTLKIAKSDYIRDAGLDAALTACTLADGGAGGHLDAGSYAAVVVGVTDGGDRTNPSPVSNSLTILVNHKIDYSAIPVFADTQITSRRVYRTLVNQTGEYFYAFTIDDNTTTTYTGDDVITDQLGERVSFRRGLPPALVEGVEIFLERAILHDGVQLYYSEPGEVQAYYSQAVIPVFPDDGGKIRALLADGNRRCYVGKTNGIHFITESTNGFSVDTLTSRHGCPSGLSMKIAEGTLIWFGGDNFYESDGVNVQACSDPMVRNVIDAIPVGQYERVVAAVYPKLGWYVASCPQTSGSSNYNQVLLVYNYRSRRWAQFIYQVGGTTGTASGSTGYGGSIALELPTPEAPVYVADLYDGDYGQVLYAVFDDKRAYNMVLGTSDSGNLITATARGKSFGFGEDGILKAMRRLAIHVKNLIDANITAKLYLDESSTAYKSRSVSLAGPHKWIPLSLSNAQKIASSIAVELVYSAEPELTLSGMSFDLVSFKRRGKVL